MREEYEHLGLNIASYQDSLDHAVWYNFENKGIRLAKIKYGDRTAYLEPGEKITIKVSNYDLSMNRNSLPSVTMINRGNPDA
jgi:hypothetical protein